MAKSVFGLLLALAGLVIVWLVVTGRAMQLLQLIITPTAGVVKPKPVTASSTPSTTPAAVLSGQPTTTTGGLASSGPYIALGLPATGIVFGDPTSSLGLEPLGGGAHA